LIFAKYKNGELMKNIFWIAGEDSGDLHSAKILVKLNEQDTELRHFGIGGPQMTTQNFQQIFPFERFAIMGFGEVLKHLLFFQKVFSKIKNIFKNTPPDLVVLTDYPGLNLRVAKLAKRFNIPVLYFISPQFWAWKYKRIQSLKKHTDFVAYILPFEQKYFEKENVKSAFVGHPISEEIELKLTKNDFSEKFNLNKNKKWIGFFPGSRVTEIKKILPEFLQTAKLFKNHEILFSKATSLPDNFFNFKDNNIKIIDENNYEMMKYCNVLAITSGTATLECAMLETPFVIVYKTGKISYKLGKKLIKIDKIGLPNIILDKIVLPELIQDKAIAKNIFNEMNDILNDENEYRKIKTELKNLHQILGKKSTSTEVTKIICELLK
jgi:lipid-A-disaccharide synthase